VLSSHEPRRMTVAEFADKIKKTDRLVIVCGAGLSYGAAPLAQDVENMPLPLVPAQSAGM